MWRLPQALGIFRCRRHDGHSYSWLGAMAPADAQSQDGLLFGRLGVFRRWSRSRLGERNAPDIFFGLQAEEANLIRLGGADLADPNNAKARFAPEAADFDGLAGRSEEADAVEARAILAEVHGIGALGEGMAPGVRTFDDDAESFGKARLLANSSPKVRDRRFERQADARFMVGIGVEIDHADFLLVAAALVHEKNGVAQG